MNVKDFKHFGGACGIYIIRNLINQHIYIGQTSRAFVTRWQEHIYSSTCNSGGQQHTPLHKAFIKYGIENFDFDVLEYCAIEKLDEREQHWIKLLGSDNHNNYNQTGGGNGKNIQSSSPTWVLQIINDLQTTNLTQSEIAQKNNVSDSVISDINRGVRHHQTNIQYPIRATRAIVKDVDVLIKIILENPTKTLTELAQINNVSLSKMKRVNKGEGNYYREGYSYPLRKKEIPITDILHDLQFTNDSYTAIAAKYNVSQSLVAKMNSGERHRQSNFTYPIRK